MNIAEENSSATCAAGDGYTENAPTVLLDFLCGIASEWIVSPEKFWNAEYGANIAGSW